MECFRLVSDLVGFAFSCSQIRESKVVLLSFIAKCRICNRLSLPMFLKVLLHSNCNVMPDTFFFPTKNVPLGDEKSKMHATFYFPRFLYSHYERRAQRKLRVSLNSKGKRQKHIIVCTLRLWRHSI